ncbi:DUF6965 family protein [Sphingobacterium spiritivorum]|uniref:DUF6965 domain-containing protein n=1 Tax=Sphingobacterium spiritivorum ATCC 33861 TaxID=525373 RepID=D7VTE6_SPHSI|nr:hypothetical protein HMPREF0766_14250 [Sphingobacterium spiritivorum ATCC 33861]SUJ02795.1 Uncharacterised protein [Sphingobacterium spiritivorum]
MGFQSLEIRELKTYFESHEIPYEIMLPKNVHIRDVKGFINVCFEYIEDWGVELEKCPLWIKLLEIKMILDSSK